MKKKQTKTINKKYLIPLCVILGVVVLFFFPEPETNFFAYMGTALFFIILTVYLIKKK